MKKALALLLALVMVLSFGTVAFADNSVTLNVVTSYGGDDGNRANFETAVKAYEESTGNRSMTAPPPPMRSGRPKS